MRTKKILNDPVYGFIKIPDGLLFSLIEHPYFQRLRRIGQMGMGNMVYPGACHTRFHHAIGAFHLMQEAIQVLLSKGVEINEKEQEALCIAILLHDVGHGPFSHALEHKIVPIDHESLSLAIMQELNIEFDGALDTAIEIFDNKYPRKFFHQLVSSQLDVDRLDYLSRDSFYTGVAEGVIGYDRIIKMMNVLDDELVFEEKAIFSIEKFLMSRRMMYWQAYLHKTSLVAEYMLIKFWERLMEIYPKGKDRMSENFIYFFEKSIDSNGKKEVTSELLRNFVLLDDYDVFYTLKSFLTFEDQILQEFANRILSRKLFKIEIKESPFNCDYLAEIRLNIRRRYGENEDSEKYFLIEGTETNSGYVSYKNEIQILRKDGSVEPLSSIEHAQIVPRLVKKRFICYPKELNL